MSRWFSLTAYEGAQLKLSQSGMAYGTTERSKIYANYLQELFRMMRMTKLFMVRLGSASYGAQILRTQEQEGHRTRWYSKSCVQETKEFEH